MTPAVSVILPAFNAEKYLGEAVASITAQARLRRIKQASQR